MNASTLLQPAALMRMRRTPANLFFLLCLLGILTYGGSFAWYVLANFDLVNLVRDMNIDDAYYYFQTARNLADGKFSTFDGGITRTNGYHPLWMLFITPFYWVLDPETALFGIKVLEILLVAAGVALIVLAARLAHLSWILLFAALPALYQRQFLFMGMEAAAALFLLGLFFLVLILFARDPARWRWALAATVFILPWVRLEYVAISISATAMLCLMEWPQKGQRLDRAASVLARHEAAVPLLASCAGILVYFAYNGLVFGGIVPVSGAVKLWWSRGYFAGEGGYDLVRNVQDIMQVLDGYAGIRELLVALEAGCWFLLVWGFSRGQGKREDRLLLAFLAGVSSLGAGHLAKIAQTSLTMSPFLVSYSAWYYVPAYLAVALIVPVRCWVAIHFIRRFGPQNRAVQQISRFCILAIGATFVFNQTSFTYPYRFVDRSRHSLAMDWSPVMSSYAGAQVINRILPEGSVIGAWDSGVFGYFSRFPVVNLDGLMNSYDYLRSPAKRSFYRKFGITHFANHRRAGENRRAGDQDHDGTLFESRPFVTGEEHSFEIWHEAPTWMASGAAGPAGHLWERMAPYFDHRTGGGVGVVVHGRMVQVFPRVCGFMRDEFMIFSWTDHEGRSDLHILDPLKSTRKTKAGFCSYTFLLPQGVVRPIHVDTTLKSDFVSELIGSHQPVILSDYHVFHAGSNLVYVKQQCDEEEETESGLLFFLHIFPAYAGVLPEHRRRQNLDYDSLDFRFASHGSEVEGTCVAVRVLPRYPITEIRTGRYVANEEVIWSGSFDFSWRVDERDNSDPTENRIRDSHDKLYVGERFLGRFEGGLDGWHLDGDAVMSRARHDTNQQPISGSVGQSFLNSYHPGRGDAAVGTALSPEFTATDGQLLAFLIAGGQGDGVGVRLLADGSEVDVWRGRNSEHFGWVVHPLADVAGKKLQLELFDHETGGWGHIMLDHVLVARREAIRAE